MLRIIQPIFIGLLLLFSLVGFQTETYAEQLNNSVKDCLEQPDACKEVPKNPSQTKTIDKNKGVENTGVGTASSSVGLNYGILLK